MRNTKEISTLEVPYLYAKKRSCSNIAEYTSQRWKISGGIASRQPPNATPTFLIRQIPDIPGAFTVNLSQCSSAFPMPIMLQLIDGGFIKETKQRRRECVEIYHTTFQIVNKMKRLESSSMLFATAWKPGNF